MINLCNENSQCVAHDFRRKAKTKACVFRSKALILKHTSELQSPCNLVCRLLLEKKKNKKRKMRIIEQTKTRLGPQRHKMRQTQDRLAKQKELLEQNAEDKLI